MQQSTTPREAGPRVRAGLALLALAVGLAAAGSAPAQTPGHAANVVYAEPMPMTDVHEETPDWFAACGLKYDYVTGPTASGALCARIRLPDDPHAPVGDWIGQAELGLGGYKLQFGINRGLFDLRRGSGHGGAVKLSFLHTWHEAENFVRNEDFVGLELQFRVRLFNVSAGVYMPLEREDEELLQYTWSAGVGF